MDAERHLRGTRALVVDDDPDVVMVHARALSRAGVVVKVADSAASARLLLADTQPELILTDMDMPGGGGLELIDAVRAQPWGGRTAIIVLSGVTSLDIQIEALSRGADDFIGKPAGAQLMVARCASLIALRRAETEARRLTARLQRYVSPPAVRAASAQGAELADPESIYAAVLFSDLRGFTSACARLPPKEMFRGLWQIHAAQAQCIHDAGGYIDKFTGDGLLAIFEGDTAANSACGAAWAIAQWARSTFLPGLDGPVPIGMGIQVGHVLRGEFGTLDRSEMTVIGQTVNLAARLCGAALAHEALVTADVLEVAGAAWGASSERDALLKGVGATKVYVLAPR